MDSKNNRVLVVNDDGIDAVGIRCLVKALSELPGCEVYVSAPKEQQSAKSQSVTFLREVTVEKRTVEGASCAYSIDGTPADCVIWAVNEFREDGIEFDFVISGINMGANVGLAAYYSGTIAAAREGALNGIRSIALSGGTHETTDFAYICAMLPEVLELSAKLSPATIVSVNTPDLPSEEIRGTLIAEIAPWGYGEKYLFHETSPGSYQMGAVWCGTDGAAGFITDVATASMPADDGNSDESSEEGSPETSACENAEGEHETRAAAESASTYDAAESARVNAAAESASTNDAAESASVAADDHANSSSTGDSAVKVDHDSPASVGDSVEAADPLVQLKYDYDCMEYGYAAITPISINLHDQKAMDAMQKLWIKH